MIESLSERVKKHMEKIRFTCFLPLITWASSLVHHGMIGSLKNMMLYNVDLTSIPPEHLASLTSCVTAGVYIFNVSGCDLVTIMDSVKSKELYIQRQFLGSEETQALVRAMESGVESVELDEEVTLDIRSLMEYSGQGKCRRVWCHYRSKDIYRDQLRTWAMSRNWTVNSYYFVIERI